MSQSQPYRNFTDEQLHNMHIEVSMKITDMLIGENIFNSLKKKSDIAKAIRNIREEIMPINSICSAIISEKTIRKNGTPTSFFLSTGLELHFNPNNYVFY